MTQLGGKRKTELRKNLYDILDRADKTDNDPAATLAALVTALKALTAKLDTSPDITDTDWHNITDGL